MRVGSSLPIRSRVFGRWPVALLVALVVGLAGLSAADAAGTVTNCTSYGSTNTPGDLAWALQGGGTVSFACNGIIVVPEIAITLDTTIDATGRTVVLNGNNVNRVFLVSGGAHLELIGLTVTGGNAEDSFGGGIYAGNPSTVTLTNSVVIGNTASLGGGGVYAGTSSTVALANSIVSGNVSLALGGGIYAASSSTVTLTKSVVIGNTASSGGGVYVGNSSTVTLTDSAVRSNGAVVGFGGGIQASNAIITLTNSTVSGNAAVSNAGGLYTAAGTITLTNSTVSSNTAGGAGGGVAAAAFAAVTLANSTVSANGATTNGGGINTCGFCSVSLGNSIIAGNTAGTGGPDCTGSLTSLGYNLIGNPSGCGFSAGTGDLVNVDPLLGPLQNNGGPTSTHALLAGSPAIDAASPNCPPPDTDQRGVPRSEGTCDIGAYERVVSEDTVTITRAIFRRFFSTLIVSATSTASPDADLFLTVAGCLTEAPMRWNGRVYIFRQNVGSCGNLDGQTATVTSSHGGVATATIQ